MPRLFLEYELLDGLPGFLERYGSVRIMAPAGLRMDPDGEGGVMVTAIEGEPPARTPDATYLTLPVWIEGPLTDKARVLAILRRCMPDQPLGDPDGLRSWRKRKQYSQEALASLFGVSSRTIINWETGTTPIPKLVGLYIEAVK